VYNLDYPVMKTEREKKHLDSLNRELDGFLSKPDAIVRKYYEKDSCYICRTEFAGIPMIIGMLLGEFLYCMRSGLDQMAWHLALPTARSNEKSARKVCFPIFDSVSDAKSRENWDAVIRLFPADVANVIQELQPYNGLGGWRREIATSFSLLESGRRFSTIADRS
jgi:hypothetical protein